MSDNRTAADAAFLAGYEKAKADAIARCLAQRAPKTHPEWRGHNVAIGLAVVAIRALDGGCVK